MLRDLSVCKQAFYGALLSNDVHWLSGKSSASSLQRLFAGHEPGCPILREAKGGVWGGDDFRGSREQFVLSHESNPTLCEKP